MTNTVSSHTRFTRLRRALLPELLVEFLARLVGWFVEIISPDRGYSAEISIRARLTNLRLGTALKDLGRGTVLTRPSRLSIAAGTSIRNHVVIMPGNGFFTMGAGSHISHNVVIAAAGGVSIGQDCAISSGITIYSISNQRPNQGKLLTQTEPLRAPVTIGDHVHIGANVSILPGVTIGDYAVIGAGAVVTRDVAPHTVVAGVPAKKIGEQADAG